MNKISFCSLATTITITPTDSSLSFLLTLTLSLSDRFVSRYHPHDH